MYKFNSNENPRRSQSFPPLIVQSLYNTVTKQSTFSSNTIYARSIHRRKSPKHDGKHRLDLDTESNQTPATTSIPSKFHFLGSRARSTRKSTEKKLHRISILIPNIALHTGSSAWANVFDQSLHPSWRNLPLETFTNEGNEENGEKKIRWWKAAKIRFHLPNSRLLCAPK